MLRCSELPFPAMSGRTAVKNFVDYLSELYSEPPMVRTKEPVPTTALQYATIGPAISRISAVKNFVGSSSAVYSLRLFSFYTSFFAKDQSAVNRTTEI